MGTSDGSGPEPQNFLAWPLERGSPLHALQALRSGRRAAGFVAITLHNKADRAHEAWRIRTQRTLPDRAGGGGGGGRRQARSTHGWPCFCPWGLNCAALALLAACRAAKWFPPKPSPLKCLSKALKAVQDLRASVQGGIGRSASPAPRASGRARRLESWRPSALPADLLAAGSRHPDADCRHRARRLAACPGLTLACCAACRPFIERITHRPHFGLQQPPTLPPVF